ncbi:putative cytochrome c oxidase subunit 5C-4 [Phoenix dactylifera]|uniref:Cytochrome c oxidase subunit 5C-4 n=1 Tax=Phoenix dactylifera TaxID=42345 RepID=A0A8B7MT80_PHODC|nr:putative cytochrome c oxidase subunit 5C-4 [Phoenix dactylifera]XP_038976809.1 putative cytochrome c oxidase subunit 5C-4 [Phoenix dactylifera]
MASARKIVGQAASKGPSPSVIKEMIYGISLGLAAGFFWKMYHWSSQRRTREFYDLLDKGEISVVVDE